MITKILTTDSPVGRAVVCAVENVNRLSSARGAGIAVEVVGDIAAAAGASLVIVIANDEVIDRLIDAVHRSEVDDTKPMHLFREREITGVHRADVLESAKRWIAEEKGISTVAVWGSDDPALEAPAAAFLGAVLGEVGKASGGAREGNGVGE